MYFKNSLKIASKLRQNYIKHAQQMFRNCFIFFQMLKIAQNCYKLHENASKHVSKCFTMLQNCSKRFKMLANCFKTASKHFRICFKIALNLLQNYVKVALTIALISLQNSFTFLPTWHRNNFKHIPELLHKALQTLPWNCFDNASKCVSNFINTA